ncbi:hypothetical protein, partial [Vibrio mimicus]
QIDNIKQSSKKSPVLDGGFVYKRQALSGFFYDEICRGAKSLGIELVMQGCSMLKLARQATQPDESGGLSRSRRITWNN